MDRREQFFRFLFFFFRILRFRGGVFGGDGSGVEFCVKIRRLATPSSLFDRGRCFTAKNQRGGGDDDVDVLRATVIIITVATRWRRRMETNVAGRPRNIVTLGMLRIF